MSMLSHTGYKYMYTYIFIFVKCVNENQSGTGNIVKTELHFDQGPCHQRWLVYNLTNHLHKSVCCNDIEINCICFVRLICDCYVFFMF